MEKYSWMLVTTCVRSKVCQLYSRSEFLKDICEVKEAWKLAKENIFTDLFHGFEHPENLIKWFDL